MAETLRFRAVVIGAGENYTVFPMFEDGGKVYFRDMESSYPLDVESSEDASETDIPEYYRRLASAAHLLPIESVIVEGSGEGIFAKIHERLAEEAKPPEGDGDA